MKEKGAFKGGGGFGYENVINSLACQLKIIDYCFASAIAN